MNIVIEKPAQKEYLNANGELHRVDGPAIEGFDGTEVWYLNGKLHRIDGPALIRTDGSCEYWNSGEYLYSEPQQEEEVVEETP